MPTYEYVCHACSSPFEELVSPGETPPCPRCSSTHVEKVLSVFAVGKSRAAPDPAPAGCGSCGHPGGPGACRMLD